MGGPAGLAIPESMTSNLVSLLQQHGIESETLPLGESDDPQRFLLLLSCRRHDTQAHISVQREPHVNPDGPIVVYRGSDELVGAITQILEDNGAWTPQRPAR